MLVEMDLPEKLRNNRVCRIYLVEVLKTIFNNCVYKSIAEIAKKSTTDSRPVNVESSLFITTIQKMVGGRIRVTKNDYCPKNVKDNGVLTLFKKLIFKHNVAVATKPEYEKYNLPELRHTITGGLHLVSQEFI